MTALLLDPHGDDAVLFACYTLLREKPHVWVLHPTVPRDEIGAAMDTLGCSWTIDREISTLTDLIILPEAEEGGHAEHNEIHTFGDEVPRISYLTYAPRGHRSTWGIEVVPTAEEIALKLRALACFESQIEQPSTRPWFYDLLDMREWVA